MTAPHPELYIARLTRRWTLSDDLSAWVEWCRHVGAKLSDDSIDPSTLLRTTMTMTAVTARPPGLIPLSIEWSENVWIRNEDAIQFRSEAEEVSLIDLGIEIIDRTENGPLLFRVFSEVSATTFELVLNETGAAYERRSGPAIEVRVGQQYIPLADWFRAEPPVIRFHNGQQLVQDMLFSAPVVDRPFLGDEVETWEWSGTNLSVESQGPHRDPASIQRRVIETLLAGDYDVVFDDDGTNEAADVVAIRADDERLSVRLFHCKYSSDGTVGNRVADLYEVCGQAQRSVHWKGDRSRLLDHLGRREGLAQQRGRTRFEKGDSAVLAAISRQVRFLEADFEIVIVQPGVSRAGLTDGQRDLLATTQLYLMETFAVPLRVISSP